MPDHQVVSREEWLAQRIKLLAEEKELTHRRDALNRHRRELPWVKTDDYAFEGRDGKVRLRMGRTFEWVSCGADGQFKDDIAKGGNNANYGTVRFTIEDLPALSVFYEDADGSLYHTYSTYSRGLDMLNGAYHLLDIVPKGRDEEKLPYHMDLVRLRDEYVTT